MFGDDYVRKIGHATENEAKSALFHILYRRFAREKGLAEDAPDNDTAKLAAAVTNKIFGESGTEQADLRFAAEKAEIIEHNARLFALDDEVCACLSGAAYNTCYARYLDAGRSRGMFSNTFLAYVRALSQGDATLTARYAERIEKLGNNILAPILSMVSLKIFRPLPYGPNERAFYDATHQLCLAAKTGKYPDIIERKNPKEIPDVGREEAWKSDFMNQVLGKSPLYIHRNEFLDTAQKHTEKRGPKSVAMSITSTGETQLANLNTEADNPFEDIPRIGRLFKSAVIICVFFPQSGARQLISMTIAPDGRIADASCCPYEIIDGKFVWGEHGPLSFGKTSPRALAWGSLKPRREEDEKQRVLDGYKAALSLTDEQKNLARKIGEFYDSQFDAAFNSRKLPQVAQTEVKLPPEDVARILAEGIGKSFSSNQFTALFKDATQSEGWTSSDALAVWYSLGNLALVVAVWTTYDDGAKAPRLISHCRSLLQKRWNMSEDIFGKLRAIVEDTEASAFASFMRCKDGRGLMTFFGRYVSRILGAPVPFSERGEFEDEMMGIKYRNDIVLEAAVCQMFIEVCTATKQLLSKSVIDWNSSSPAQ